MKKYTYSNQDLMKMQARPLETKIQVSAAKFLEFCQKTNWNVSLSFSGGQTVQFCLICLQSIGLFTVINIMTVL